MSHYETRLEADKAQIRDRVAALGRAVSGAIAGSVAALLAGDHARSYDIMLDDLAINRDVRALDKLCHGFVARHLPSAGHLRFISSVMRLNVALERIGDYAKTIAREAVHLHVKVPDDVRASVEALGGEAVSILDQAVKAFIDGDVELARGIRPQAKAFGRSFDAVHRQIVATKRDLPVADLLAITDIFTKLDRVSDQAKNIGEEALFAITGETKAPKVYRILFVDARNTMVSPLAEAIARKAFPDSGLFASAGWSAGEALAAEVAEVAGELGLDLGAFRPQKLTREVRALDIYHVVVGLGANTRAQIGELPFATIYQEWPVPSLDGTDGATRARLREICHGLSVQIRDLMVRLRGEDAA